MSIILNVINYFWKLGFSEQDTDIFMKRYSNNFPISIDMVNEKVIFGKEMGKRGGGEILFSQRNFVIMEAIDRFIEKGYLPQQISLINNSNVDFEISDIEGNSFIEVKCAIWEEDFSREKSSLLSSNSGLKIIYNQLVAPNYCLYSSRLKAGLIECKYAVFQLNSVNINTNEINYFDSGLLEESIKAFQPKWDNSQLLVQSGRGNIVESKTCVIEGSRLVSYRGKDKIATVPDGVLKLSNAVFWNHIEIEEIKVPSNLISLGGDTFYNCLNLTRFVIPISIEEIGDNPFANCPRLVLENKSPWFQIEDDALYDTNKSRLIHCSINRESPTFHVPEGVISIGKHAFFNCSNLEKIVLPSSVRIIENNPFSNLPLLKVENHSKHFKFIDGALYNSTMSTLFYYQHSGGEDTLSIPEGVRIIGRHSFYNCHNISKIIIPSSVEIIGYNPFARCSSLVLENNSPEYHYIDDTLYDRTMSTVIFHSIASPIEEFIIPEEVKMIGRSAFFGCSNLRSVHIPEGVTTIERSAFANCANLMHVEIPSTIESIGEWAFSNCPRLKMIEIPKHTKIEHFSFHNSPVQFRAIGFVD